MERQSAEVTLKTWSLTSNAGRMMYEGTSGNSVPLAPASDPASRVEGKLCVAHTVLKFQDCHRGHHAEATGSWRSYCRCSRYNQDPASCGQQSPGYVIPAVRSEGTRDSSVRSYMQ